MSPGSQTTIRFTGLCLGAFVWVLLVACGESSAPADTHVPDIPDTQPDILADTGVTDTQPDTRPDTSPDTRVSDTGPDTNVCLDDRDCILECARGRCTAGTCVFAGGDPLAPGCVVGVVKACVAPGTPDPQAPGCFFCNPAAAIGGFSAEAFAEGFETGAGRLQVDKLAPSPASWTLSTHRAASGDRSLYFGDPATQSYDVGERAAATASTTPLLLPEGGVDLDLHFQLWADTEETPGFDFLRVLVQPAQPAGGTPREVWSSDLIGGTTRGVFVPITVSLGRLARGDRVVFEADSIDEVINRFEGFYIDEIRVDSACCSPVHGCDDGNACTVDRCLDSESATQTCVFETTPGCCLNDVDCDDGDACTLEVCSGDAHGGGTCSTTTVAGCCSTATDCDDNNPCTEDRCAGDDSTEGQCVHAPLCCLVDNDCDDNDPCTTGSCVEGGCRYISSCCESDVGCDDGLACTRDTCEAGTCNHEFTFEPGCCIPDILTERFDLALSGWTLSPATNNIGWRLHPSNEARSAPAVLYYGHPTLNFYESGGRNTGTATTPTFRVPVGVELTLSLSIRLDVEANPARDIFRIELLLANGQTVVPLVEKAELTRNTWQDLSVDLSWASGQFVALRFVFDTIDGTANTGRGVLIDDLRLLSSCLTRQCGASEDCGSRASCIVGECLEAACRFTASCP